MTAFMVEYNRNGNTVRSRRITTSEATFMLWCEELHADPAVTDVEIKFGLEGHVVGGSM